MKLKKFSLNYGLRIFKSLSEEPRVRILHLLLAKKEMCTMDLEFVLGYTQAKTSRHLIYLKNAGIVSSRLKDKYVFYFILDEVHDILDQVFNYLEKDQLLQKDIETYDILFTNRELAAFRIESKKYN